MKIAKASSVCLVLLTLMFCVDVAVAQKFKLPFRNSKPASGGLNQRTELDESDGPWLIMCASFVGDEGEIQARKLVQELRSKFRINAYTYKHQFDFSQTVDGIGWEVVEKGGKKDIIPKRMKPAGKSQFEEIAVLVGDFPSVDDARAQKALSQIKELEPESLNNFDPNRGSSQQLRVWREMVKRASSDGDSKAKGPLSAAFLLPNPLLPDEYFQNNRVDHFVLKLNKGVKYSLIENPKSYSVRVATFRGESTFQLNEIKQKEREYKLLKRINKPIRSSKLAEAAEKANKLTKELRRLGIEAYEFHDRHESYVCVAGFEWISKTDSSGAKVINPAVVKVINTFRASVEDLPNLPGAIRPQVLPKFQKTDIVFDAQPIPVMVPKAETSTASRLKSWR